MAEFCNSFQPQQNQVRSSIHKYSVLMDAWRLALSRHCFLYRSSTCLVVCPAQWSQYLYLLSQQLVFCWKSSQSLQLVGQLLESCPENCRRGSHPLWSLRFFHLNSFSPTLTCLSGLASVNWRWVKELPLKPGCEPVLSSCLLHSFTGWCETYDRNVCSNTTETPFEEQTTAFFLSVLFWFSCRTRESFFL